MVSSQFEAARPEVSAWVSASAGTGKTKVLVDRVLRLLLAPVSPERILCLTFTKAAAAEMEARVLSALARFVDAHDAELIALLTELLGVSPSPEILLRARRLFAEMLDLSGGLAVKTIHAFAQEVLRYAPFEKHAPLGATIMDDAARQEGLYESYYSLLSEAAESPESALSEALLQISFSAEEQGLFSVLVQALSQSRDWPESLSYSDLHESLCVSLGQDPLQLQSYERALVDVVMRTRSEEEALRAAAEALLEAGAKGAALGEGMMHWIHADEVTRVREFQNYVSLFFTKDFSPRAEGGLAAKRFFEEKSSIRALVLSEQARLGEALETLRVIRLCEHSLAFVRVLLHFRSHWRRYKRDHAVMDYDDIILATLALFRDSERLPRVLSSLDRQIEHILLDEAQDTSAEQWEIVRILWEELLPAAPNGAVARSVFVVGDPKQSIYRFQGAAPHWFYRMHARLQEMISVVHSEHAWRSVLLTQSFRSTAAVLEAVDAVLADPAMQRALLVPEGEVITHQVTRQNVPGVFELWPSVEGEPVEAEEGWWVPSEYRHTIGVREQLAERIVTRIAEWLAESRVVAGRGRAIRPSDILILVRQREERLLRALTEQCALHGVPIAAADRLRLTDHLAIRDLLAWAQCLLFPADDLALAAVLKSPLFGMSEEELLILASGRGSLSLWAALEASAVESFARISRALSAARLRAMEVSPLVLFTEWLEPEGMRERFVSAMGPEVHRWLDAFLMEVARFESEHLPSLQACVAWFARSAMELKYDADREADGVRIMTVHGAKGLQAPIVFLPDASTVPTSRTSLFWTDAGGCLVPWWAPKVTEAPAAYRALREQEAQADYEEYLRLLYVAMTRAEDELYVCGFESKTGSRRSWYDLLTAVLEK